MKLAIFAISLPVSTEDEFKNAKFSHIRLKLGNDSVYLWERYPHFL
jgi:hypothetical protein